MSKRILVLFAHPALDRSEVNQPLLHATRSAEGVTVVDLYSDYPTYQIDIDREQQRLRQHEVVVFMFPLYWYSTPSILKEWQDLVLEYGFAYGREGVALHHKTLLCAITAGGAEKAYQTEGYNHYSIGELLRPIEQTASLCGMRYLPPFVLFSARTAYEEGRVQAHIEQWLGLLAALREDRLDLARVSRLPMLNAQSPPTPPAP